MSIALESSTSSSAIQRPAFVRTISIFEPPGPGRKVAGAAPREDRRPPARRDESNSGSSSIGRNSDSFSDDEDFGEVQSSYKGPLDTMDALEESLPIRRGISKFYRGKSKSFTSLADVCNSPAEDLGKPDNVYNRKRKNLLACSNSWDKNRSDPSSNGGGGISKRPTNSSRSTLAFVVAMSSSESNSNEDHEPCLPPLHPGGKSRMDVLSPPQRAFSTRSFSLADLQAASARFAS
ncbi:hypothetical protein CKAN_02525400 [Cinnamomum micranthum f. kanehirae]|uniref:Uncharacterized protein n=1 Tax=Cinnamomum micranthum f. kanehirae TaxID=337451 RepID=A0A3S3PQX2_9MAGN|nr:hypothetical protein CKAN_02525400 [Cinnamomum micranthum f. kanehirae]